ncbi:hypothetical protein O181_031133 [Austropuccinia psidii MF-1]|uniref:Integrase catalytic domain-containing protein n=1 Tax=Austropuccinia psidii MF-1 TaxID=1389203 RepID=A0A9Q3CWV7_9BASI|nr:hypothetical protein [Austropuccinia psidii MF-1]
MPNARTTYRALKDRFNKISWSSIVRHTSIIFDPTDNSNNLTNHAITVGEAIEAIENQIGAIDSNLPTTLSLFFSAPQLHDQITNALDTILAAHYSLTVHSEDILNIVRQLTSKCGKNTNNGSIHLSRINAQQNSHTNNKQKETNKTPKRRFNNHSPPSSSPIVGRSEDWKKKWLTPKNPCFYCGEAGHWVPNCTARLKASKARNMVNQSKSSVARIGMVLALENNEILLDSGATHSVVGDLSLFTDTRHTNMRLSVASSEQFNIDIIGRIKLKTKFGTLIVRNVLYCAAIPGIVLSIGQLLNQDIDVQFLEGVFILNDGKKKFVSHRRNFRWFLEQEEKTADIKPVTVDPPPPSIKLSTRPVMSRHQRMGHLSIRNIKKLMKFNAIDGFSPIELNSVGICHPCSIAKSEHQPIQAPSQKHISNPGDMILADLMGPFPISIDGKKYAIIIQDSFSWLTAFIPLHNKTEARGHLQTWMTQFMNTMKTTIKAVRTDNGAEFKNNTFDAYLKDKGIIHELSMPYEHHQNGKIEQTNRLISEIARTFPIAANLPTSLWPWAFKHAVWIFNQSLHVDKQKTPYEIISGMKPSLHLLRVFDAKAYVHNHLFRKDMTPRGIEGYYYLGVAPNSKGWLFWIPSKNTVAQ